MTGKERNATEQAEKKRALRLRRLRDCVVIFVCLAMIIAYISSLNMITPEPEYAFAGGTSKDVPVFLIGITLDEEEITE